MENFQRVSDEEGLSDMVNRVYESKLDISGGWGYTAEDATIIHSMSVSKMQFEHNLAHMRVYLEMNILQPEKKRYSGIDILETGRKDIDGLEKVTYTVTGILEKQYNGFIDEYKDGYGKEGFDIREHFSRRKKATLVREIEYWFDLSEVVK